MQVIELTEADDDFKAAQVSIGLLGVITEVTFSVRKKFLLEEIRTHHTLSECLKNLDDLVLSGEYEYPKIWVEFFNDFCIRYQTRVTNKQIFGNPGPVISFLTVSNAEM